LVGESISVDGSCTTNFDPTLSPQLPHRNCNSGRCCFHHIDAERIDTVQLAHLVTVSSTTLPLSCFQLEAASVTPSMLGERVQNFNRTRRNCAGSSSLSRFSWRRFAGRLCVIGAWFSRTGNLLDSIAGKSRSDSMHSGIR